VYLDTEIIALDRKRDLIILSYSREEKDRGIILNREKKPGKKPGKKPVLFFQFIREKKTDDKLTEKKTGEKTQY